MAQHGDERILIQSFRDGDEQAFRRLFEQQEDRLRARIRRRLPAPVQRRISISDILQETRIVAFDRRAAFEDRGEGAFGNWVLGIADMRARKALRHAGAAKRAIGREVTRAHRPVTGRFAAAEPSASQLAMASELRDAARAALRTLPEDYRRILELTRDLGLTLDEAAHSLGRSFEATKKLRTRALARFADTFAQMRSDRNV